MSGCLVRAVDKLLLNNPAPCDLAESEYSHATGISGRCAVSARRSDLRRLLAGCSATANFFYFFLLVVGPAHA